jgi:hypothetical protein
MIKRFSDKKALCEVKLKWALATFPSQICNQEEVSDGTLS